ncbi:MAG: Ldh family oxidoreductase [Chloroflexi bacterium]|nr:Ldh family oxidoreductase [Chloroflexota bacterium]
MPRMKIERLRALGTAILNALGSPPERSAWVAETLLRANLAGHDSHGFMRLLQYAEFARDGFIDMSAEVVTRRELGSTVLLDAQRTWGQVAAKVAMERAIEIAARQGVSMVALVNSPHIGRLGEYVVMAAERDMIGTAYVNSQTGGKGNVTPWGGIEGRFTPTPLAFAAPSGMEWPVLVDITASVMPEGKVRDHFFRGAQLPENVIIDADGNPSRDPKDFYGPPAGGLLPLGGPVGHKGYALGVMIEMLAGGLSGAGYVSEAAATHGNGVLFQVMNIAAFEDIADFKRRTRELIAHTKSARPRAGVDEVLFPGEPEYRSAKQRSRVGIELPERLWQAFNELPAELGVAV